MRRRGILFTREVTGLYHDSELSFNCLFNDETHLRVLWNQAGIFNKNKNLSI